MKVKIFSNGGSTNTLENEINKFIEEVEVVVDIKIDQVYNNDYATTIVLVMYEELKDQDIKSDKSK